VDRDPAPRRSLQGNYRTLWRGAGLDLADLREYQHHDDVRHIDWNVTARLQQPYVRQFTEDREMSAWFLVDLSGSVDFGSDTTTKRTVAREFVGVLARLLTRHGNRVGAVLYGSAVDTGHPCAQRSPAGAASAAANGCPAGGVGTGIDEPARPAAGRATHRQATQHLVRRLRLHQRTGLGSDARPARRTSRSHRGPLFDPLEMDLPDLGLITMRDAETGEQIVVDTHDRGFRKRFAAVAERRENGLREALAKAGVDTLELATDDDLPSAILRFADLRKQRSRLANWSGKASAVPTHLSQWKAGRRMSAGAERERHAGHTLDEFPLARDAVVAAGDPALVLLYVWLLRRRKKTSLRYASLSLVREALGARSAWRRHVPPTLLLVALAALLFATARPAAVITLPSQSQTVVLAMDVSGSMRATDVQPNRLVASQEAAKAFVADLPRNVRVAVVAFAGSAAVVQAPTLSREDIYASIDRFQLQRATAIGSGIVLSLATIFPEAGIDLSQITGQRNMPPAPGDKPKQPFTPVPPASYNSAAIILLTDGQRTTGPDPLEAAKMAADRGRPGLHGRHRHQGRRDDRVRRLVDAGAPRRGNPEGHRQHHPRRLLLRRNCGRPEEGLPGPQHAARRREARDRNQRPVRGARCAARRHRSGPVGVVVRARGLIRLPFATAGRAPRMTTSVRSSGVDFKACGSHSSNRRYTTYPAVGRGVTITLPAWRLIDSSNRRTASWFASPTASRGRPSSSARPHFRETQLAGALSAAGRVHCLCPQGRDAGEPFAAVRLAGRGVRSLPLLHGPLRDLRQSMARQLAAAPRLQADRRRQALTAGWRKAGVSSIYSREPGASQAGSVP
jgi:uncharacterized protein (DUF58 family)